MTTTLTRIALAAVLLAPTLSLADPAPVKPGTEAVRIEQPHNYCVGGIEDRKIIVDESQLTNPFRQTTRLGCEVDGGDPRTMPDLPAPSPEQRLLV
jgi:hypothetical protein